jgi:hypothetical protein
MLVILSVILLSIVLIGTFVFLDVFRLPYIQLSFLGMSFSLTHWIGWIGALFIAVTTPAQPIVKRLYAKHMKTVLNMHMIGNLLAVLLVTIHFSHQVTRPATAYPDLGTGIALYLSIILLVSTGFVMYSGIGQKFYKQLLFFHPGFALTFYIVLIVHILVNIF